MIFKTNNLSFAEMAQWIDTNSYNSNRDDEKLVEYLYHIIIIKSRKRGFFYEQDDYEDFALYCISKCLVRFANKDKLPVKSIVNYLNTVMDPWHAEYVREFCCGSADFSTADFNVNDFSDYLIDSASEFDYVNYGYLNIKVSKVIRTYLSRIPIRKNSAEWSNICTSCFLTLLDRITYAADICEKSNILQDSYLVNRIIRDLKTRPPILFHLEEEKSCYISVLVNELVHALAVELTHTIHSKVSVSSCLHNLVKAACNKEE